MITKSELQKEHDRVLAEERARLGEPPSAEVLLAYSRGELSHEEEERVAELLACYPEVARALTQPFPADDAKPGEPGYVSDAEVEARWSMLQDRMHGTRVPASQPVGRVLQFWRFTSGLAAALAVAFGAMLWQARSELGMPQMAAAQEVLIPDRTRGADTDTPTTVTPGGESYVIVAPVITEQPFTQFRLSIVDESNRSLWTSGPQPKPAGDNLAIVVPRAFLRPGRYQVVLSGVAAGGDQRLETYSLRITR